MHSGASFASNHLNFFFKFCLSNQAPRTKITILHSVFWFLTLATGPKTTETTEKIYSCRKEEVCVSGEEYMTRLSLIPLDAASCQRHSAWQKFSNLRSISYLCIFHHEISFRNRTSNEEHCVHLNSEDNQQVRESKLWNKYRNVSSIDCVVQQFHPPSLKVDGKIVSTWSVPASLT